MTNRQNSQWGSSKFAGLAVIAALLLIAGGLWWKIHRTTRVGGIPADPQEQFATRNDEKPIDLYFDRSKSMQGFIKKSDSNSLYKKLVVEIETVLKSSFPKEALTIQGFGRGVDPVEDGDRARYKDLSFYQEMTTNIDKAVDQAIQTGNLSLIVTDMFQSAKEVSDLTSPLRGVLNDARTTRARAIGLIGATSSFNGNVEYETDKYMAHEGTLPFYILVIGPAEQVAKTMTILKERIFVGRSLCPSPNCEVMSVFISKRMARQLAEQDESGKHAETQPVSAKEFEQTSSIVPELARDRRVREIELLKTKNGYGGEFDLTMPVFWIYGGAPISETKLMPVVSAARMAKGPPAEKGGFPPVGWMNDPEAKNVLEAEKCEIKGEQIVCKVKIKSKLPTTDIYLFKFEANVGTSRGVVWDDWSFDEGQGTAYGMTKKFETERGKTRNLKLFVEGLLNVAGSDPPPLAARAFLVVRSK